MSAQNYLMIDKSTNIVTNIVMWDGNPDTWTPPDNVLMLEKNATPAKTWVFNQQTMQFELTVVNGAGAVGFIWDGAYAVTNASQPQTLTS